MNEYFYHEADPNERGTVTKTVPPQPTPPPAVSDDTLKAGIATLGKAAHDAHQSIEAKVEATRRSLAPTLKEAAALQHRLEELDSVYGPRLEEVRRLSRSPDLLRYHSIDDARARLFDCASSTLTALSSAIRCLGQLP